MMAATNENMQQETHQHCTLNKSLRLTGTYFEMGRL